MEKLDHGKDGKELYEAVIVNQSKGRPWPLAKLRESILPQPPPPSPRGSKGHNP
jgi:hypothetical protein